MNKALRKLLVLVLAIVVSASAIVGGTYAWFTDSVTSARNTIQSGNLDIDIELLGEDGNWISLEQNPDTAVFNYNLWEPGFTQVETLKIKNKGNLALKYELHVVPGLDEVKSSTGKSLAETIDVYMAFGEKSAENFSEIAPAKTAGTAGHNGWWYSNTLADQIAKEEGFTQGTMLPSKKTDKPDGLLEQGLMQGECICTVVLHMQEEAGNEFQNLSLGTVGFELLATQAMIEGDSFNNEYDKDADVDPATAYLFTGDDINKSTTSSGKFVLSANIKTSECSDSARYGYGYEYIIRNGADYTLDLNGKTITHDTVNENTNHNALTYAFVANHAGTNLTINGEGKVYSHNSEGYACAVQGKDGTLITLNGGDYEVENGIAVWAGAGAHIVINGGSFVNREAKTDHELIYTSGGVIDIYGGFFHNTDGNYTLNVEDRNRATGFINVYGGTYVNFDPSTGGQDPNNIKVADGYKVVSETKDNGDIWYTVVAE